MSFYIHGKSIISIAIAEQYEMVREALCSKINEWENCKVIIQAATSEELIDKLKQKAEIRLVLLDVSLPGVDAFETAACIRTNDPEVKILLISEFSTELAIALMIKTGTDGYISKAESATELKRAILEIMRTGKYFTGTAATLVTHQAFFSPNRQQLKAPTDTELIMLKYLCTDMTYKEIAFELKLSERQVDYIRESMFRRFNKQSRAGLVTYIIKSGIACKAV